MPLYVDAHLIVEKVKNENDPKAHRTETYTDIEIEQIKQDLLDLPIVTVFGKNTDLVLKVHSISFIKPTKDLTTIHVPLAELRKAIADKMAAGSSELDLENLLLLIRTVYRENRD